jgi:hypothetical protein
VLGNQLRALLETPISRTQARVAFAISATVVLLAAAALILLADERPISTHAPGAGEPRSVAVAPPPAPLVATTPAPARSTVGPRQDPQDQPGSRAARRAARALATHAALQHVPYRRGGVRIELTGARDGRALLTVTAPTRPRARAAWRAFLARFHDSGRAYRLHLSVERRERRSGFAARARGRRTPARHHRTRGSS